MAVPDGRDVTSSDDPSSRAPIAFPDFRLFDSAQDILDHNKRIIKEIKANHETQTPEALARTCFLVRELNTNISAVMQAYRSIGDSFAQYISQHQQHAQQQHAGGEAAEAKPAGEVEDNPAAAAPWAPPNK